MVYHVTYLNFKKHRTTLALAYLFGTVFKLFVRKIKQYEIEKQKDYLYRN